MSEVVNYQLEGNIGVISVNNPPVNALAQAVREGILNALKLSQQDSSEAVVLHCEGRTFIAGALGHGSLGLTARIWRVQRDGTFIENLHQLSTFLEVQSSEVGNW